MADLTWQLVASADVDRDGAPDLIWRNTQTGANVVWYLNGTTIVGAANLPAVADLTWQLVAAQDVNQDGRLDLIWRNTVSGANVVWYHERHDAPRTGESPDRRRPGLAAARRHAAGGGRRCQRRPAPDLIWRNTATGANVVWYLNGPTLLARRVSRPSLT